MSEKVILIVVDGMRPDALTGCGNPYVKTLLEESTHTLNAKTVMPSVTLPVHYSLFHSLPPTRHGITTNLYTPPVRYVNGLFEVLKRAGKKCAMFYSFNELRDVLRPGAVSYSVFRGHGVFGDSDSALTQDALCHIKNNKPDFVFLYLGMTDETGHKHGWMSDEQLACVSRAVDRIHEIIDAADGYTVIVTADHGGHERMHGTDIAEDMTVPLLFRGGAWAANATLGTASVLDISPTITSLLGCAPDPDWEGQSLIGK